MDGKGLQPVETQIFHAGQSNSHNNNNSTNPPSSSSGSSVAVPPPVPSLSKENVPLAISDSSTSTALLGTKKTVTASVPGSSSSTSASKAETMRGVKRSYKENKKYSRTHSVGNKGNDEDDNGDVSTDYTTVFAEETAMSNVWNVPMFDVSVETPAQPPQVIKTKRSTTKDAAPRVAPIEIQSVNSQRYHSPADALGLPRGPVVVGDKTKNGSRSSSNSSKNSSSSSSSDSSSSKKGRAQSWSSSSTSESEHRPTLREIRESRKKKKKGKGGKELQASDEGGIEKKRKRRKHGDGHGSANDNGKSEAKNRRRGRGREAEQKEKRPWDQSRAESDKDADSEGGNNNNNNNNGDNGDGGTNSSLLDYNPENAEEEMALLNRRMDELMNSVSNGGLGRDDNSRLPVYLQQGPFPTWLQIVNDILFFQNSSLPTNGNFLKNILVCSHCHGALRCCCCQALFRRRNNKNTSLPIDNVLYRLENDMDRLQQLIEEVKKGKDIYILGGPTAQLSEIYGDDENDVNTIAEPVAVEDEAASNDRINRIGGDDDRNNDDAVIIFSAVEEHEAEEVENKDNRKETKRAVALMAAEDHLVDEKRNILAQTIPLYRRKGFALKTCQELLELLKRRYQLMVNLLNYGSPDAPPVSDVVDNDKLGGKKVGGGSLVQKAGYMGKAGGIFSDNELESLGAPLSGGVDGSSGNSNDIPPALFHAMHTTFSSVLMSDLFTIIPNGNKKYNGSNNPFDGTRAQRMHSAWRGSSSALAVHNNFVTDYSIRASYYPLQLRKANMQEDLIVRSTAPDAARDNSATDSKYKSFSIHVDYVRFQPSLLSYGGAHDAEAGFTSAGTSISNLTSTSNTAVLTTLSAQKSARNREQALAAAVALANTQKTLVPFDMEAFYIASLLDTYEEYRMYQLNLNTKIKSRYFYYEQLRHVRSQLAAMSAVSETARKSGSKKMHDVNKAPVSELKLLQAQLEQLYEQSSIFERSMIASMIDDWRCVLKLRSQKRPSYTTANTDFLHSDPTTGEIVEVPFEISEQHESGRSHRRRRHRGSSQNKQGSVSASASQSPSSALFSSSVEDLILEGVAAPRSSGPPVRLSTRDLNVIDEESPITSEAEKEMKAARRTKKSGEHRDNEEEEEEEDDAEEGTDSENVGNSAHVSSTGAPGALPTFLSHELLTQLDNGAEMVKEGASFIFNGNNKDDYAGSGSRRPLSTVPSEGQSLPPSEFRFYLRKHGRSGAVSYITDDDPLHYVPVVEGTDIAAYRSRHRQLWHEQMLRQRRAGGRTDGSSSSFSSVPAVATAVEKGKVTTAEGLGDLQFFQVVVFARSESAMPPQFVGCTIPRPLTTAKVLFFNETFEIRALQEPTEVLLHVIALDDESRGGDDNGKSSKKKKKERKRRGNGTVVATVNIRPTLTREYLLVSLQPPISFLLHGRSFSREAISGVLALSTTWTSTKGLSVSKIEELFLSGEADPRDPQHLPLLRVLDNYYRETQRNQEQMNVIHKAAKQMARRGARVASVPPPEHSAPEEERRGRRRVRSANGRLGSSDARPSLDPREVVQTLKRAGSTSSLVALRRQSREGVSSDLAHKSRHEKVELLNKAQSQDEIFFASYRLLMLRRRYLIATEQLKAENQQEARLYKHPIPLSDKESYELRKRVQREIAKEDEARQREYGTNLVFDEKSYYEDPTAISGLALSPLPKATKVRLWQERQRRMKLTRRPARNISDEELLESVVTVPKFDMKLVLDLKPRSQLNPRRKERPKTEDIDRDLLRRRQDSRIVVHIMKALDLPERMDGTVLEPFVQAGFVYENAYSRSEVGCNPSWFQTVELPFQPLDFSEDTLSMIDDDIIISVYDKVEIRMPSPTITTGAVAHETHYRTERRLIGTLRLPFYSLHQAAEARIEGVYPLTVPRWLLGYKLKHRTPGERNPFVPTGGGSPVGATPGQVGQADERRPQTSELDTVVVAQPTIQLYISLWPPLQREESEGIDAGVLEQRIALLNVTPELRYLHHLALKWRKSAGSKVKSIARMNGLRNTREIEPFVFCSTGDMVLACRYLLARGGPPPMTVTNIYEAVRFVSLLPFTVDIMTWGDKDVWSTNVELLTMRSGDYEELALLLAHFLRHLAPNSATYVVIGSGEIYKQTILVLHALDGKYWKLIDPRNGLIANVETPYGTILKNVHYVLSHDQMWANVQLSGLPHRMSWDFHNPTYWMPCFPAKDRRAALCLPSLAPIQREVLDFAMADLSTATEVEIELRAAVKKALFAWRQHSTPNYQRGVEGVLRELLVEAEAERCRSGDARGKSDADLADTRLREYFGSTMGRGGTTVRHRRRHRRSRSTARRAGDDADTETPQPRTRGVHERPCLHLVGAPVTSSYNPSDRSFQHILREVFETAAHEVGTDDVTFAIGTYAKTYTKDVCAIWVFLIAICKGVELETDEDEVEAQQAGATAKGILVDE